MLSHETEGKIIKLFLGIANGDSELNSMKQNLIENYPINPVQIFNRIDRNCKGGISQNDLISFLNNYNIPCSNLESELFFYFYDLNMDGLIDFIEFLNIIISDYNYLFKKVWKKKFLKGNFTHEDINCPLNPNVENQVIILLEKEMEFCRYICELINDIKNSNDFNLEDMFFIIKSYSFITSESIRAFFDRNEINYNDNDIKSIITRIDNNQDSKICFERLKMLFDIPEHFNYTNNYNDNSNILLMSGNSNLNKTHNISNQNLYNESNNNLYTNNNNYSYNNTPIKNKKNENIPNLNLNNINYDDDNVYDSNFNNYNIEEKNIPNEKNIFIPNKEFKLTDNFDENEMQYICAHCSRSGSPVLRKKNINKQIPIISPRINNNVNIRYKEFIQEKRENSLNRSFEKSLSRSSSVEPKEGISPRDNNCCENDNYDNNNNSYHYNFNYNNNIHNIKNLNFDYNKNNGYNIYYKNNDFYKNLNRNYSKDNIINDDLKNKIYQKNLSLSGLDLSRKRNVPKRINSNYNFKYQ